jgi:hypothetical protein
MNNLPIEIQRMVYQYDPTYRLVYDVCMDELRMLCRQDAVLTELLVDQEDERNMFCFVSSLLIDTVVFVPHL